MEGRQLELLRRKGVYPYEYNVDRPSKLAEKQLPPINRFFSHLTEEGISEDDYEHAKTVWKEFEIGSMRGYHDLARRLRIRRSFCPFLMHLARQKVQMTFFSRKMMFRKEQQQKIVVRAILHVVKRNNFLSFSDAFGKAKSTNDVLF